MSKKVKRLFDQFRPNHYLLSIDIDDKNNSFSGEVIISGQKTGRPAQRLTFHQKDLKVTKAHVTKNDKTGDRQIIINRINCQDSFDEVRLHSQEMIYPGDYTVRLEFKGKITPLMHGVYPANFKYKGKQQKIIATQFESHHAREVFPCIDEPEAKATFKLTLGTQPDLAIVSNTPIESQQKTGQLLRTTFEITPKMSTYLLAFVVGKMDFKEAKTKSGITVRAYATPDNIELTDFSLDVAVKCLDFFGEYFAIEYPLEKCDLLALPDFASGAMENWGCITFREQALLVDPKNSTLANKQYVALVVAHELAHQWFGNLVTMRWWTDLWLNEGFASWIEYLAIDKLFPNWHLWEQFVVDERQLALKLDALEHTHPIEVEVRHPDEIRAIFDTISYSKGASVIHMLYNYLGADDFRNGLSHYLSTHQYKNTDTVDLWTSLEKVSDKPVKQFMHEWTSASGFPILKVNIDDQQLSLSQDRFFINPNHKKLPPQNWPIPLLANDETIPAEMTAKNLTIKGHFAPNIIFNDLQSGFYRVTYNPTHLERLGMQIDKGHLNGLNRLGILTDLFEASKAGQADTVEALHFLRHFKSESDYLAWDTISGIISSLKQVMDDEDLREEMKPYIRQLVKSQVKRLGWDSKSEESHFEKLLRPIIFGMAASADEPAVVKKCLDLFKQIKAGAKKEQPKIDPDLRGVVFGTVARLGAQPEFEKLVNIHNTSKLTEEKTVLAASITAFKQPEIISHALKMITSDDVRLQDTSYWIAYSFLNRHAKHLTWEWLVENWEWLKKNMGEDLSFYRMPIYAARAFSDERFMPKYKAFFEPKMSPALERSYRQGLEMLMWQSAWKKRSLKEVKTFFKKQSN